MSDEEEYELVPVCEPKLEHNAGLPLFVQEIDQVIVAQIPPDVTVTDDEFDNLRKIFSEVYKGEPAHKMIISRIPIQFFKLKRREYVNRDMVREKAPWKIER